MSEFSFVENVKSINKASTSKFISKNYCSAKQLLMLYKAQKRQLIFPYMEFRSDIVSPITGNNSKKFCVTD